ncbi:MAG TPA: hypothetical protein VL689_08335 [Paraburkholderia sp.]|jgi:hypothetical protein|nr:hypothetical protein [Paraburkholderia sp.]
MMPGGEQVVVSRYGDDVWDFWPYLPHEDKNNALKRIDWSFDLGDGTKLIDAENAMLLAPCKDFIWSIFPSSPQPRPGSQVRPSVQAVEPARPYGIHSKKLRLSEWTFAFPAWNQTREELRKISRNATSLNVLSTLERARALAMDEMAG